MNCIYCNSEMEKGQVTALATGSMPVAFLEWYSDEELEKKGLLAGLKRKGITIKDKDGYDSYYCQQCKKAFAEFPTK